MAIKSMELEPTRDNLLQTLEENILDRNKAVWYFARFCDAQEGKCSIAIDAKWGNGKTFFVRHVQMLLEAFNEFTNAVTEDERAAIKNAFKKEIGTGDNALSLEPQVCIYYDAWANDNDGDPILSLVYEVLKSTAQNYSFKKSTDGIQTAALIVDFFTGKNTSDFVRLLKENDPLSELKAQREVHDLVSELLDSLLYEQGNRLLIIIDELDRCKPEYSVRLLERIKHYFANERITYVFAVNIEELQHTVRSFYGEGFDACRYLDRFFDYRIALPPANTTRYYQQLGLENGSWVYESVCRAVIDYCDFGIREIDKFYRTVKSQRTTPRITIVTLVFSDGNALQFGLCVVVPIIIGLRMYNMELYNDFIGGNNPEPLISILGEGDVARGLCSMLIDRQKETYDNSLRGDENKAIVRLPDRLQLIYEALFKDIARPRYAETHIGECSFSRQTKETIIRTASMLSEFARFD